MLVITLQREKCIGCNYCVEAAPDHFRMSTKDGKSTLLRSKQKKEFYTFRTPLHVDLEAIKNAAQRCPVRIIKVTIV